MEILKSYPMLEPLAFLGVMVIFCFLVYLMLRKTNQLEGLLNDGKKAYDILLQKFNELVKKVGA